VLHLAELVMSNALALMGISTASIQLSSRLAVLMARETVVTQDTSALQMLQGEPGVVLM